MNDFLITIDSAMKRLATVVLLLVTSVALDVGSVRIGEDLGFWVRVIQVWALVLWVMSMLVASKQILESTVAWWIRFPAGLSFATVYIAVAAVSAQIGYHGAEKALNLLLG